MARPETYSLSLRRNPDIRLPRQHPLASASMKFYADSLERETLDLHSKNYEDLFSVFREIRDAVAMVLAELGYDMLEARAQNQARFIRARDVPNQPLYLLKTFNAREALANHVELLCARFSSQVHARMSTSQLIASLERGTDIFDEGDEDGNDGDIVSSAMLHRAIVESPETILRMYESMFRDAGYVVHQIVSTGRSGLTYVCKKQKKKRPPLNAA